MHWHITTCSYGSIYCTVRVLVWLITGRLYSRRVEVAVSATPRKTMIFLKQYIRLKFQINYVRLGGRERN